MTVYSFIQYYQVYQVVSEDHGCSKFFAPWSQVSRWISGLGNSICGLRSQCWKTRVYTEYFQITQFQKFWSVSAWSIVGKYIKKICIVHRLEWINIRVPKWTKVLFDMQFAVASTVSEFNREPVFEILNQYTSTYISQFNPILSTYFKDGGENFSRLFLGFICSNRLYEPFAVVNSWSRNKAWKFSSQSKCLPELECAAKSFAQQWNHHPFT